MNIHSWYVGIRHVDMKKGGTVRFQGVWEPIRLLSAIKNASHGSGGGVITM